MSHLSPLRTFDYLRHMLEALERIQQYTEDMIELTFLENKQVQDAVIRNIEILGEAAKNIESRDPDFTEKYTDIPWSDIYLMRNRVSHGYFCVDLEIIWKTIENDLPVLEQQLKKISKNHKFSK